MPPNRVTSDHSGLLEHFHLGLVTNPAISDNVAAEPYDHPLRGRRP